jgi:hypothetical protein
VQLGEVGDHPEEIAGGQGEHDGGSDDPVGGLLVFKALRRKLTLVEGLWV